MVIVKERITEEKRRMGRMPLRDCSFSAMIYNPLTIAVSYTQGSCQKTSKAGRDDIDFVNKEPLDMRRGAIQYSVHVRHFRRLEPSVFLRSSKSGHGKDSS
jgi:hypothetical protein